MLGLVAAYAMVDRWWRRRAWRQLVLKLYTLQPVSTQMPTFTELRTDGELLR